MSELLIDSHPAGKLSLNDSLIIVSSGLCPERVAEVKGFAKVMLAVPTQPFAVPVTV